MSELHESLLALCRSHLPRSCSVLSLLYGIDPETQFSTALNANVVQKVASKPMHLRTKKDRKLLAKAKHQKPQSTTSGDVCQHQQHQQEATDDADHDVPLESDVALVVVVHAIFALRPELFLGIRPRPDDFDVGGIMTWQREWEVPIDAGNITCGPATSYKKPVMRIAVRALECSKFVQNVLAGMIPAVELMFCDDRGAAEPPGLDLLQHRDWAPVAAGSSSPLAQRQNGGDADTDAVPIDRSLSAASTAAAVFPLNVAGALSSLSLEQCHLVLDSNPPRVQKTASTDVVGDLPDHDVLRDHIDDDDKTTAQTQDGTTTAFVSNLNALTGAVAFDMGQSAFFLSSHALDAADGDTSPATKRFRGPSSPGGQQQSSSASPVWDLISENRGHYVTQRLIYRMCSMMFAFYSGVKSKTRPSFFEAVVRLQQCEFLIATQRAILLSSSNACEDPVSEVATAVEKRDSVRGDAYQGPWPTIAVLLTIPRYAAELRRTLEVAKRSVSDMSIFGNDAEVMEFAQALIARSRILQDATRYNITGLPREPNPHFLEQWLLRVRLQMLGVGQ